MANPPGKAPEHFIVFIPGYMGSQLRSRSSGDMVWINIMGLLKDPFRIREAIGELFDAMVYPNDDLEPAGILKDVLFVPPLFKQEQYGRMLDALEGFGYQVDPEKPDPARLTAYTFAYDWRQDNRISGRELGVQVKEWRKNHNNAKAWLIGHSNGGIISRWYIEKEGGKDHVSRLFLMGSPWDGAPKSMIVMQRGLEMMFTKLFSRFGVAEQTRELVRSFPSSYQLIPVVNPFLQDADNHNIDPFEDTRWLDKEVHRKMLLDGRKFNQELGTTLSVETYCFFGVKHPTTTGGTVKVDASGKYVNIDWARTEAGDGTVPETSAVHPNAREKLPFSVGHGDIYVDPAVLEKLEWEMVRKFRQKVLAKVITENYIVQFEPGKDDYNPGEKIEMWATVADKESGKPVQSAEIDVQIQWVQGLLGIEQRPEIILPFTQLERALRKRGYYQGSLEAPEIPGYYRLFATVRVANEKPISLEELVIVEPDTEDEQQALLEQLASSAQAAAAAPAKPLLPEPAKGAASFGAFPARPKSKADDAQAPIPARQINAYIDEHKNNKPLEMGREYNLVFSIDPEKLKAAVSTALEEARLFQSGESMVELTVQISSKDFIVYTTEPQKLRLPLTGRSRNRARFDIEPRHEGPGEITALFFKNNNFIQGMILRLHTGPGADKALLDAEKIGRATMDGAFVLKPRDISLFIRDTGAGFECTMVGAVAAQAFLRTSKDALANRIDGLRQTLQDIVFTDQDDGLVYQEGLDIPEAVNQASLEKLARAGWLLFNELFGPRAGAEAQFMGKKLRELSRKSRLNLQIVSREFTLPWSALYLADKVDPSNIDFENFLGLRHVIEFIPYQADMPVLDPDIEADQALSVSLNLNQMIDEQFGVTVVADQLAYWREWKKQGWIEIVERTTPDQLVTALADPATTDQILYYYGHAAANLANPGASVLDFGDGQEITKDDLEVRTAGSEPISGQPLVFINACESGQLSPHFYDGFMPYFVSRGARGMIGTECQVPALFAADWARQFFDIFLNQGKSLGQIFLELRRQYYLEHNNLLGLMYSLYCDGDTRIVRKTG